MQNHLKWLAIFLSVVYGQSAINLEPSTPRGFLDPGSCQSGELIRDGCGTTLRAVEEMNKKVRPVIQELVAEDYFRFYKVDLSEDKCPYSDFDLGMCGNRACVVDPVEDESEIPEFWKTKYLSKLANNSVSDNPKWKDSNHEVSCSCLSNSDGSINGFPIDEDDADYCYPEDESQEAPGVWVSLLDNPERFTGYYGPHANKMWQAIYQENCFGYNGDFDSVANHNELDNDEADSSDQLSGFAQSSAESQFSEAILGSKSRHNILDLSNESDRKALNEQNECIEQRLFYRLLSGMHSSVSTHLCFSYLNKTTGVWGPNLECFESRVGRHPERISNLYFNYALVARAVAKLRYYIDDLYFCVDDPSSDLRTRKQLLKLTKIANSAGEVGFNETSVFSSPEGRILKDEFKKRVKNVSGLMSCVGCERCRLWGKLQAAGYGTALKILFELPEKPDDDPDLYNKVISRFRRTELVALVNTFDRLAKSVYAVQQFRLLSDEVVPTPSLMQQKETSATASSTSSSAEAEWDPEFTLAWEGIKFILRSYIEFPKNIWNLFIHYSALYWNQFVGRQVVTRSTVRYDL